jgi:hypothetical protein
MHISSKHTVKSAKYDLTIMAEKLFRQDSVTAQKHGASNFVAPDLMKIGSVKLTHESLKKFNSKELLGYYSLEGEEGEDAQAGDLPVDFFEAHEETKVSIRPIVSIFLEMEEEIYYVCVVF